MEHCKPQIARNTKGTERSQGSDSLNIANQYACRPLRADAGQCIAQHSIRGFRDGTWKEMASSIGP